MVVWMLLMLLFGSIFRVLLASPSGTDHGQGLSDGGKVDWNDGIAPVVFFPGCLNNRNIVIVVVIRIVLVKFFTEDSPGDIVLEQLMNMTLRLLQLRHECGSTVGHYFERDFGRTRGSPKFQNAQ